MEMINEVRKNLTGSTKAEADEEAIAEYLNASYEGETTDEKANSAHWEIQNELTDLTACDIDTVSYDNVYDLEDVVSKLYELNDKAAQVRIDMEKLNASEQELEALGWAHTDVQDNIPPLKALSTTSAKPLK